MTQGAKAYIAVLSCLHTIEYRPPAAHPRQGDLVLCRLCDDYRHVGIPPVDYIVNCVSCKKWRIREYGAAFVTAETRAIGHAAKNAGHRVRLLENGKIIREWYHSPLPVDVGDAPPF